MIGSSLPEYLLVRVFIVFFQFAPAFFAAGLGGIVLKRGLDESVLTKSFWALVILLALECLYAVAIWRPFLSRLNIPAKHPPLWPRKDREALFDQCLANIPDLDRYLHLWCMASPVSEIKRENVREFYFWSFLYTRPEDADEDMKEEIESYLAKTEEVLGRKLEPGKGSATTLRLTFDKVDTRYRSVLWYFILSLVDFVNYVSLSIKGFQFYGQNFKRGLKVFPPRLHHFITKHRSPGTDQGYYYRPHTAKNRLPVVFFHGIGAGLYPYVHFINEINTKDKGRDGDIGIIAPEILPISFRLTEAPLPRKEILRQLIKILDFHGIDKFVLVAHSFGSVMTSHMLDSPELDSRIDSIVLIDPVTMMLHMPHVAYNFTARAPKSGPEWQLWYFASMDPGVSHVMGRHFFWGENIVWKEDLTGEAKGRKERRKVAVSLSGNDLIVDAKMVREYLERDVSSRSGLREGDAADADGAVYRTSWPIEVLYFPDLNHSHIIDVEDRSKVLSIVRSFCSIA